MFKMKKYKVVWCKLVFENIFLENPYHFSQITSHKFETTLPTEIELLNFSIYFVPFNNSYSLMKV